jgi:hypothetical protein
MSKEQAIAPVERPVKRWVPSPWWMPVGASGYEWRYASQEERANEAEMSPPPRICWPTVRYFILAWSCRLCPAFRRWNTIRRSRRIGGAQGSATTPAPESHRVSGTSVDSK